MSLEDAFKNLQKYKIEEILKNTENKKNLC